MSPTLLKADPSGLKEAVKAIRAQHAVAVPTETVYGLAADARSDQAVGRIYTIKGRPHFNPLIVHIADPDDAGSLVILNSQAQKLIETFWPGPLTLVAPIKPDHKISPIVLAGNETLAIRCPDAPVMRELIRQSGAPLAAPSANRSGSLSPTRAEHVADSLADWVGLILDDGPCEIGVESTIIDVSSDTPCLLRPGGISREAIEAVIGPVRDDFISDNPKAPGQLKSHYAPKARLRLNAENPEPGEAFLAFGPNKASDQYKVVNLSPDSDLTEAAARLFAALHELDAASDRIAVAPIPHTGLGAAINDRLLRASAD